MKLVRGNWGTKVEFILTCVAYAVGLGNVWRFPYLAFKNGGGAFLIPYWIMQVFIGMPLFFMELSFGQFAGQGPITIWKANPLLKGIGISMVIVCTFIVLYFTVIVGYIAFYFFSSMQYPLPWSHCEHYWSSPNCRADIAGAAAKIATGNLTIGPNGGNFSLINMSHNNHTISPTEDYFKHFVLEMTSGLEDMGTINWKVCLCCLFAGIVVLLVLLRGIKSLGKVAYFNATFPYVLLLSLLINACLLPGSTDGILYFLTPKWHRLADASVWSDAATQVFFSLGVGMGGLNLMASFNNFKNNCLRDAILVPCVDCLTSFLCGLVVFAVLGFMAHDKGVSVEEVAVGGPGLAFIAYPEALSRMPVPTLWAILFFFMMLIIGFSSLFTMTETAVSSLCDEYPLLLRKTWKRTLIFRGIVSIVLFLLALPMTTGAGIYLIDIVDSSVGGFPLLIIAISEIVAVMYIYGYGRFAEDLQMMMGKKVSVYWKMCWCFIAPVVLVGVVVFKSCRIQPLGYVDYIYPAWAQVLGWLVMTVCVIFIPGWFVVYFLRYGGCKMIKKLSRPVPDWGPRLPENRTGIYADSNTPADIPSIVISDVDDQASGNDVKGVSTKGEDGSKHRKSGKKRDTPTGRKASPAGSMKGNKVGSVKGTGRIHDVGASEEIERATVTSVKGETVTGVKGAAVTGVKEATVTSVKGETVAGVKGEIVTGVKGATVTGVKGETVTGVKGATVTGVKGATVTGVKGETVTGVKGEIVTGVKGAAVTGVKGETVTGVKGEIVTGVKGATVTSVKGEIVTGVKGATVTSVKGAPVTIVKGAAAANVKETPIISSKATDVASVKEVSVTNNQGAPEVPVIQDFSEAEAPGKHVGYLKKTQDGDIAVYELEDAAMADVMPGRRGQW
ncbi:sodium- and chloride-dependent glycine transporter 1-like [Haliotis rubra]|uniref:sodium- and chloride-dependent glycine transporter 1-like n=1 Tax=Haliotis rubra TaxID=36100 RepID=UPI001EE53FF4|nr:sodium- and chloride-dependent glycine transporter 1-like [Haliotis rubra]